MERYRLVENGFVSVGSYRIAGLRQGSAKRRGVRGMMSTPISYDMITNSSSSTSSSLLAPSLPSPLPCTFSCLPQAAPDKLCEPAYTHAHSGARALPSPSAGTSASLEPPGASLTMPAAILTW